MKKSNLVPATVGLIILITLSGIALFLIFEFQDINRKPQTETIRVACVGDSLTQSTQYPLALLKLLGSENYTVQNFGAGSTTVSLSSETPYLNTTVFKKALDFQPNIVIIMLGTNDAQPSLKQYNASFVGDYKKLIKAFEGLDSQPKIWIVLPPPIFSNQSGKINPDYFTQTVIPLIEQTANETNLPIINVYSALENYPNYFPDGIHPNVSGSQFIAEEIYKAIIFDNAG